MRSKSKPDKARKLHRVVLFIPVCTKAEDRGSNPPSGHKYHVFFVLFFGKVFILVREKANPNILPDILYCPSLVSA